MRRYRGVLIGIAIAALLVLGLYLAAGSWGGVDHLRTDYLALRHMSRAFDTARARPLDRDAIIRHVARALALAPNDAMVRKAAPDMLIAAGDFEEALALLTRQTAPDPYTLGMCLVKTGRVREGASLLTASLNTIRDLYKRKAVPDQVYAMQLNNVGYVFADAGVRLQDARHMLELAASMLPLDPNVIDSLGWLYYRLGETRQAVFCLERAARHITGAGVAEIHYHLGAAYAREGKTRRAKKMLLKALRADPAHPEATVELRKLGWRLPGPDYVLNREAVCPATGPHFRSRTEDASWTLTG